MSPREQMVQMFDAIDADSRRYVLAILKGEFNRAQKAGRPALRLVGSPPMPRNQLNIEPVTPLTIVSATPQPRGAAR